MEVTDCEVAVREAKKAVRAELLSEIYRMKSESVVDERIIAFIIAKLTEV